MTDTETVPLEDQIAHAAQEVNLREAQMEGFLGGQYPNIEKQLRASRSILATLRGVLAATRRAALAEAEKAVAGGDHSECDHGEGYTDGRLDAAAAIAALADHSPAQPVDDEPTVAIKVFVTDDGTDVQVDFRRDPMGWLRIRDALIAVKTEITHKLNHQGQCPARPRKFAAPNPAPVDERPLFIDGNTERHKAILAHARLAGMHECSSISRVICDCSPVHCVWREKTQPVDDGWRSDMEAAPKRYRHKKRGTTYQVIADDAEVQIASGVGIDEAEIVVVYRAESDGSYWVRRRPEFYDGRFELLPTPPAPETPDGK